jgi:hypothetical protein
MTYETTVYPHLYRYDFVAALAMGGPASKHQRRLLMVMTAMADHWSLVMPDALLMAQVMDHRVNTVRDWLYQFHEDQWLSDVDGTDLCLLHLPKGSDAYQAISQKFEWHTRAHAPLGGFSREVTSYVDGHLEDTPTITPVNPQRSSEPIPLTARALQLAVDSVGRTKEGQFAYIAFVQHALMPQPEREEDKSWDRYLPEDY